MRLGKKIKNFDIPNNMNKYSEEIFTKVYHYHIPKCAGTAINLWLDSHFHYTRSRPAGFETRFPNSFSEVKYYEQKQPSMTVKGQYRFEENFNLIGTSASRLFAAAKYSWEFFDVIHGHPSALSCRLPQSFVFTVLRDPVSRCISQYNDYARLQSNDYAHLPSPTQGLISSASNLPIKDYIREFIDDSRYKFNFCDTQARLLVQDFISPEEFVGLTVEEKCNAAKYVLSNCMDHIGVQDEMENTLLGISYYMGFLPEREIGKRNVTSNPNQFTEKKDYAEIEGLLLDQNKADLSLYNYAKEILGKKQEKFINYDDKAFEEKGVDQWLSTLRPFGVGKENMFDMNMPLIGRGFLERDSPGTIECCRWSTGEGESVLYIPVEKCQDYCARLYFKGWLDWEDANSLKIEIDGKSREFKRTYPPVSAECINFNVKSDSKNWVKVIIRTAPPQSARDRGIEDDDQRVRGFLLWRYSLEKI